MPTRKKGNIKYDLRGYGKLNSNFTQYSNDIYLLTTVYEFKVYCFLCDMWNKDLNYAFPSINSIVKGTGVTRSMVQKAIKGLEETGLIQIFKIDDNNYYSNNCYRVYFPIITKNEIEEQQQEIIEQKGKEIDDKIESQSRIKEIDNYYFDDNPKE